jgi:hypothetical protein
MDLRDVAWDDVDWVVLASDRDTWGGSCEHGNEPQGSINFRECIDSLTNC